MSRDLCPEPPERMLPVPDRAPNVEDDFSGPLRADLWVDHYLPHWTTPERSAARYDSTPEGLRLRIDADQHDWREEDAPLRVSNLQTGTFSGEVGSAVGTHRHAPDISVRTATPTRLHWAPRAGRVEVTVSASTDSRCMVAAWLVGTEHLAPADAGEICLFEIDGSAVGPRTSARCGVKAHGDGRLTTDMAEVEVPVNAAQPHTWTAIWGDGRTAIGCDGIIVRELAQAPDYPLFLMLDLFEIGPPGGDYPKTAMLHAFRGWSD